VWKRQVNLATGAVGKQTVLRVEGAETFERTAKKA
jgi:hypothetical protein